MNKKIVRSICIFSKNPSEIEIDELRYLSGLLEDKSYEIQTLRICSPDSESLERIDENNKIKSLLLGAGTLRDASSFDKNLSAQNVAFNIDLTNKNITLKEVGFLFKIIKNKPKKTFDFTYTFNNPFSSPFFPSANYNKDGFAIALQSTDLAEECDSLGEWLNAQKALWTEIADLFKDNLRFLGIDSSVAPLGSGNGSLIGMIKKFGQDFSQSTTTDTYLKITKFIKTENPKPIGLCGLMFPCLEDFELAEEYEKGNFTIERNIYLSLHSGVGIDTYPIGVDESPKRVLEILKVIQGLSNKYQKPLSARFVSDGKAKIGDKSDFKNQYLKDVIIRGL